MADSLITITGMDELKKKLINLDSEMSGGTLITALKAGAEVYRRAIESVVSRISTQAKVIITERRLRGLVTAKERSFLIGIDKRTGWYLYFKEHGHKAGEKGRPGPQKAEPFFDDIVRTNEQSAFDAAMKVINDAVERVNR